MVGARTQMSFYRYPVHMSIQLTFSQFRNLNSVGHRPSDDDP